jgi:hypothetical protein
MAVTLAQAKLNVTDDIQLGIIDEFAKSSFILNNIPFDDCVSPVGGGATLTYGYTRLITQPTADFRPVNSEYTPSEVQKQRYTTDLKVFGGAYEIDRIIAGMGGIADEVALQSAQKVKAASALFSDTIINGNSSADANVFDGLDVAVTGTDTTYSPAQSAQPATVQNTNAQPGTPAQAQNTTQQAPAAPVTWDLEAGKKDPMGYIKHHTQALSADTIKGWNKENGNLSARGYYEAMAGRHYNNMQNLEQLARSGRFSDDEKAEIMKALNQEALRFSYYGRQNHSYRNSTAAYDPKLHGPDSLGELHLTEQLAKGPVEFGWGHSFLSDDTKKYSDDYFFK